MKEHISTVKSSVINISLEEKIQSIKLSLSVTKLAYTIYSSLWTLIIKISKHFLIISNLRLGNIIQFSSVAQSCPTLCDSMNHSTPGLPVHHQLPEFTQTHVHRVGDAIQTSHPLSSPSPPALNPFQHQGLFQ